MLQRLRVDSFGALAEKTVEFAPGLNVPLGPNEAGKSTLFQAILHTLFTPVRLSKNKFQERIQPFLPLGGGDTIGCELQFTHEGGSYRLARRWGGSSAAELALPGGSIVTGEEQIASVLKDLLPAGEATVRSVFMTWQSGLPRTLEELKADPQTVGSFSDLLNRAVLETDGVSVARFQKLLSGRVEKSFEHWDRERQRPEGGRGIDNPYVRGVGLVLEAYYRQEALARLAAEAEVKEEEFDRLNRKMQSCRSELESRHRFLREHEPAARAALERRPLEADLEKTLSALAALQQDYDRWPELQRSLAAAATELPGAQARAAAVEDERRQAQALAQAKGRKDRFARVQALNSAMEQARLRLAAVPPFPHQDLETIEKAAAEAQHLEAALSAGARAAAGAQRLTLALKALKDLPLSVQVDAEAAQRETVRAGDSLEMQAEERVFLSHPDWSLEVRSVQHTEERARLTEEHARAEDWLRTQLAAKQVASVEEARQAWMEYERRSGEERSTQEAYRQELGQQSYEELEREFASTPSGTAVRELDAIVNDLLQARRRLEDIQSGQEQSKQELDRLERDHRNREALLERIAELSTRKKELQQKISALAPLPPEFADAGAFLNRYEETQRSVEELAREEKSLSIACARAEENMPEESSEEVRTRLAEAGREFHKTLQKAQALARIQSACRSLLGELDGRSLEGFAGRVSQLAGELSGQRYRQIRMGEGLPEALLRQDGQALPYGLLSAGTKDLFALALRLAMAEAFLEGKEGFLIMDDPLVDLDPDRQAKAAAVLESFAQGRQLILFTCHPLHAERFASAHRIELAGS